MDKKLLFLVVLFYVSITKGQMVTTFAGSSQGFAEGTGTAAQFNFPYAITLDPSGIVFVADYNNNRIRKITAGALVSTFAGSTSGYVEGTGTAANFNFPSGVASDGAGFLYIADYGNSAIRKITPSGVVTTLAGGVSMGSNDGTGSAAQFSNPTGVAANSAGNVFVADRTNNRIRKITPGGVVTTLAGSTQGYNDGTGSSAQFYFPIAVAADDLGNVYVADYGNHKIRKITSGGVVTTFAGSTAGFADGTGTAAQFYNPSGLALDSFGNLFVADAGNNRIRKITPTGVVSTYAGSIQGNADGIGTAAQFRNPTGVVIDGAGIIYVADTYNHTIRKISAALNVEENTGGDFDFKIYPNPAKQFLNIQINSFEPGSKLTITDVSGKMIFTTIIGNKLTIIDTRTFAKGVYFLTLQNKIKSLSKKIIIE